MCVGGRCSLVIYLYLMDNEYTSNIILGSVGVSTIIELWKVCSS